MTENPDPLAALSDEDVRIVPPDYTLKKIIGEDVDIRELFNEKNVEKAESIINGHKASFSEWVRQDIAALEEHYKAIEASPENSEADLKKLARAAFVIKSQAGTFGFALATRIAKMLDDFCAAHPVPDANQLMVIRKHIDTLSVIFHKNITGTGGDVGKELQENLSKLIEKYASYKK